MDENHYMKMLYYTHFLSSHTCPCFMHFFVGAASLATALFVQRTFGHLSISVTEEVCCIFIVKQNLSGRGKHHCETNEEKCKSCSFVMLFKIFPSVSPRCKAHFESNLKNVNFFYKISACFVTGLSVYMYHKSIVFYCCFDLFMQGWCGVFC